MKKAFELTLSTNWEAVSVEELVFLPTSAENIEIELELPEEYMNMLLQQEFKEELDKLGNFDEEEEAEFQRLELELGMLSDNEISVATEGEFKTITSMRSSCCAHTLQLVVKDGLAVLNVTFYLSCN